MARLSALRPGCDWVDADVEVELRAGKSIAAIFANDGEPAFRDLEAGTIAELTQRDGPSLVLACGGGAILREETRRVLREAGKVVWLKAAVPTILAHIAADVATNARRPNLTTAGGDRKSSSSSRCAPPCTPPARLSAIETDDRSVEQVANEIAAWLQTALTGG